MSKNMTVERALHIGADIQTAVKRWGKNASSPYSAAELTFALAFLMDEIQAVRQQAANTPALILRPGNDAELVKLRRQLAAANARVTRLAKLKGTMADKE